MAKKVVDWEDLESEESIRVREQSDEIGIEIIRPNEIKRLNEVDEEDWDWEND